MKKKEVSLTVGITGLLVMLAIIALALYGYVVNIIQLFAADAFNGMVVARGIGVVIPFLGSVLGYF